MKLIWAPRALERAEEIHTTIQLDNPSVANRWVLTLFQKTEKILQFPLMGRIVPETKRRDIREILWGPYRIIYLHQPKQISILTIHHGKQLLRPLDLTRARDIYRLDDPIRGLI